MFTTVVDFKAGHREERQMDPFHAADPKRKKGNPNDRREEFPTLCLFQQLYALVKYLIPMFRALLGPYWELDCDYHLSLSLLSHISVCVSLCFRRCFSGGAQQLLSTAPSQT